MSAHSAQLELPLTRKERTVEELHDALCRHGGCSIDLTLTHNRVSLVSIRFVAAGALRVRLSRVFLAAPDEVVTALGQYLAKRSRAAWRVVTRYVHAHAPETAAPREVVLPTQGLVYDLALIRDQVNRLYFGGRLTCRVGWGRTGQARRRARTRTIRYGSFSKALNLVRINPVLDDARVPVEFIQYIVFHELLHAAVPSEKGDSRWLHHHETYRKLERRFPELERMQALAADLAKQLH